MSHIVIVGASPVEQTFFLEQLTQHSLTFLPVTLQQADIPQETEVLSVFIDTPVTDKLIQALPNLRLIACRSTGFNHIDMQAAKARNVVVANAPTYGNSTVAEYAFTLLLMITRRMAAVVYESVAADPNRERERGTDLFGKTMGIIGTGNIGLGAARIAKGFGMNVVAFDAYPRPQEAERIGYTYTKDMDELLEQSNVVSLHVPYIPENHHLLSKDRLRKLPHGAVVINTARGELIDTTALVAALQHGHVGGAALDVMENEYLMDPDEIIDLASHSNAAKETLRHAVSLTALQRMPNVILTNHNAYNTNEAVQRINQTTADNISNFLTGKEVHAV